MKMKFKNNFSRFYSSNILFIMKKCSQYALIFSFLLVASAVQAQSAVGTRVTGAVTQLGTIINATTTIIVTVAIIFSGYQISFNNKRFGEVWPILLGGLMVGAAGLFAQFFIAGT